MKIYFFGIDHRFIDKVHESGFDGGLFLYNAADGDHFTRLTSNKENLRKDFNYMVALRPHTMSPQYLSMIHRSVSAIIPGRLEINLISGDPKEVEKPFNSFVGDINDSSSKIEKSEYLIKYLESLNSLKDNCKYPNKDFPNIYVSTTNEFVLKAASSHGYKMITYYPIYKRWQEDGTFDRINKITPINRGDIFLAMNPVIMFPDDIDGAVPEVRTSDGIKITAEDFVKELKTIKDQGFNGVFLASWEDSRSRLLRFLKENKQFI